MFLLTCVFLLMSCSEFEDATPRDTFTASDDMEWINLLNQINTEAEIILVQQGSSIQEAIDVAGPNAVIYIEPGEYNERLKLNRPDVKLVAACLSPEEKVLIENPSEVNIMGPDSPQLKTSGKPVTLNREDLGNGIAHYTFDMAVGPGTYDVVRLHRVVKEKKAYKPCHAKGEVFFVHGSIQDFEDIFLTAGALEVNEYTSAPYYLAANDIDVWGIDLAWNFVPMEETNFEFMKNWGVEKDIDQVLEAMALARLVRVFTAQGYTKLNLLGYSYGVPVIYGAAGRETQMKNVCRNIKGLIPVDNQVIVEDPDERLAWCAEAAAQLEIWNAGEYNNPMGVDFIGLGQVVVADPNGHDLDPNLTNIQIMNFILTDHSSGSHFLGGNLFALNYSDSMRLPRLALNIAPYQPQLTFYETNACGCPDMDVSFDDYLEQVKLPILFISSEGGFKGDDYTATLTQTTDYERLHVNDPAVPTEYNFGHADLWLAYSAPDWVWEPMRQWLLEH